MGEPTENEGLKIARELRRHSLFAAFSEENVSAFAMGCSLRSYDAHDFVWRRKKNRQLSEIIVVLSGCLVIWDDSYGEETIDALVTAGQVLGEFEYLGYESNSLEIKALTDCQILSCPTQNFETLREISREIFYQSLAKSLVEKLQRQNTLLKFRNFGRIEKTITYLLGNFADDVEWRPFTNITDEHDIDEFEIEIFWTKRSLLGLVATESRTLGRNLPKLIRKGHVAIALYDKKTDIEARKWCVASDFSATKFPDANFYKIKVLDYNGLTEDIEV